MTEFVSAPFPSAATRRRLAAVTSPTSTLQQVQPISSAEIVEATTHGGNKTFGKSYALPRWVMLIAVAVAGVAITYIIMRLLQQRRRPHQQGDSQSKDGLGQTQQQLAPALYPQQQHTATSSSALPAATTSTATSSALAGGKVQNVDWDTVVNKVNHHDDSFMLMIHADWCGACKRAMPAYVQAAEQAKRSSFLAVEQSHIPENASTDFEWMSHVRGYPTFFVFRNDAHNPVEYTGTRTPEAFIAALEQF